MHYDRTGTPSSGVIVARTPTGSRTLASVPAEDSAMIAFLTEGRDEPVGSSGTVTREGEALALWTRD